MAHDGKSKSPRILLHSCCAPCTIYPMARLLSGGFEITGFFYNPNIHPFGEFELRLSAVSDYYRVMGVTLNVDPGYDVTRFLTEVFASKVKRCETCWRIRLRAAAARGKEIGADAVTTTLLYSIYQDHSAIQTIGREEAKDAGVEFLYEDFRIGWHEGQRRARGLGIYRQKYCGCIFSEEQRYKKKIEVLMRGNRGA